MAWRNRGNVGRLPYVYRVKHGRPFAGRLMVATTITDMAVIGIISGAAGPKQFRHDELIELSDIEIERVARRMNL